MNAFLLAKPVFTEKSMLDAQVRRIYTFEVSPTAAKKQIKDVVEKTFGVTVVRVRTVTTKGKTQRTGRKRIAIDQPSTKKAMVMVKEGQSIALFDVQDKK